MIINEPIEQQSVSGKAKSAPRTETVKLVDMGRVSVETKGIVHGLELGFTPRI